MAATCNAPLPPISRPWIPPPSNTAPPRPIICARPSGPRPDGCRSTTGWQKRCTRRGLGYYAAGNVKLADPADAAALPAGDFVTAPQLTPLFARTLARQAADVLAQTGTSAVLEFGAGTGALAEGVLRELDALGQAHTDYLILEVSADLRAVQAKRLAPFGARVRWLDALPTSFSGCVLANEVLDAMPVSLFRWSEDAMPLERGVALGAHDEFVWEDRPASPRWRPRWPSACRPCPAMYPRSICRPRPGSARWAAGWNAARRC